jgi:hypothetical protein
MSTTPRHWPYRIRSPKDPDAVLDYQIDWSDWLGDGESIAVADWAVTGGTEDSATTTATTATIWLSGGTEGETISATCSVTTDLGRSDDRTLILRVAER